MAESWNKWYTLMHQNIPVAEIELDEATVSISKIGQVYAAEHVPVGIAIKKGKVDRAALNEWWRGAPSRPAGTGLKKRCLN